jgi:hypothetical protein
MAADPRTDPKVWLEVLRAASLDWREPMSDDDWEAVKADAVRLPPELRALYEAANGARLPERLRIFPFSGAPGEVSTILKSQDAVGVWHFGRMGEVELIALQKKRIRSGTLPDWIAAVEPDGWVYAIRNDANSRTRLFPSLPSLLTGLLPGRLAPKPKPVPPPLPAKDEAEFANSSDFELIGSNSFEVDIVVEAPPPYLAPRLPPDVPPPPPADALDPDQVDVASATTEKVKIPRKKRRKVAGPKKRRGK